MAKKRVVVLGGGFAGLAVCQGLKYADVDILLIDRANHHLFQPLLYQVATAALAPSDITAPLREVLKKQANVEVLLAEALSIDVDQKTVTLDIGDVVPFDILVVATGASHSYFGHSGWEEHAPGLKTIQDSLDIRERILFAFEEAERLKGGEKALPYLRFVVVGGGPTGVEMAGAIAEISRKTMLKNFRHIQPEKAEVYLVEAQERILPGMPPALSARAEKDLTALGVTVLTKQMVKEITANEVVLTDRSIHAATVIWGAGNKASALLQCLPGRKDGQGRVYVEEDLTLPGHPDIFILGDAMRLGELPAIAPVAIQQGHYVAKLIHTGNKKPFRYIDKGMLATIGKSKAVGVIAGRSFSGFFAWLVWSFVHIAYLISFGNRFIVMFRWMTSYITGRRTSRLIVRKK